MSSIIDISISSDTCKIVLNRRNPISARVLCSLLKELGIAGLCGNGLPSAALPIASEIHIEIPEPSVATNRSGDSQGQSLPISESRVSNPAEENSLSSSADWLEFEKKLNKNSIKNEPEWCLIYSYFVLRESNREIDKNTVRNVYKASGRYTKNRSKDFPTNVKKCVERNWLTYDRYNISITEEGLKHVLEHLYCQG